jgi:FkbM family methyltransferase
MTRCKRCNIYSSPLHDVSTDDVLEIESFSLNGEDAILLESYFSGLCNGRFLELGAFDGIGQSNTLMFAKYFNWTGVLIEASPRNFASLKVNRQESMIHHTAVCSEPKKVHFVEKHLVGGIWEFMAPSFRKKWHSGIEPSELPEVNCRPLTHILHNETYFDFFSLDVEGGEFEVLRTLSFEQVHFGVILVEDNEYNPLKNEAVKTYLENRGYKYRATKQQSSWFVNQNFDKLYRHLMYEARP